MAPDSYSSNGAGKPPGERPSSAAAALVAFAEPNGEYGLSSPEAAARLAEHGPNILVPEQGHVTLAGWLLRPFTDPMVGLLLGAGLIFFVLGDYFDTAIVLIAVVPIALVSLLLEIRAERTLEQLKRLAAPTATVWRDGREMVIPTEDLVPGDLILLQEGDIIPADGTLVRGARLMVDESALTGESQPVVKDANGDTEDRGLLAGTTLLSGRGISRITETGARTQYGKIGTLVAGIRQAPTQLQRMINRLVWQLTVVGAAFCVGVAAIELAYGHGWIAAVTAAVSLAIAAIPEEFAMVYALYLTLGAWRLSRDRALVRRLAGVETLGSTTVICSDKTGTLTLGRLEVVAVADDSDVIPASEPLSPDARKLVEAAVLACEPNPFDPLDQAILRFAASKGVDVPVLHGKELVQDYPFDPAGKYLSHVWRQHDTCQIAAKGSPEGILDRSWAPDSVRKRALEVTRTLAESGLRVIAIARGPLSASSGDRTTDEQHLRFLGVIALSDTVRPGVSEAIRECREAGVRVIMITGDYPITARAIADELHLPYDPRHPVATGDELDQADAGTLKRLVRDVNIFARTRPEQKFEIVEALQAQNQVVAMTGDGVNDAPALRKADIGIAMGRHGTEVARAAATLVLMDDNFATIVNAVRDGRRIFENLRRAFTYLIAFQVPILLLALAIPLVGSPLLLLPVHMVWLELIMHPTASLVFESDPPPEDLMRRPPRKPQAGILTRADAMRPVAIGITLFVGVIGLYLLRLTEGASGADARSLAMTTLMIGQVCMVLTERSPEKPVWRQRLRGNRILPVALLATPLSLLAALYVPFLADILKLAPLSAPDWALAAVVALAMTLWLEPVKVWRERRIEGHGERTRVAV